MPKRHTGVDLKASVGEDVYAAYDGVVKAVYALSSKHNWGKGVVIEHSEFTTTYMHVNPVVNVGAHVNNGQKIAIIVNIDGDEHLHFGVRSGTYSAISKRGALPQKHGDSNYQEGRFTGCKSDPLFPEKFVDPMKLKYEIAIPVDSDGDGLTDEEELKYGTDLNKQDSDDDGFSDKLEVDLALEYKPILALSDGELFYPTKV
ncbi:MAG: M23 family metallopeptidase, partial [Proteobacteria bacterium]|nr:M23 family metallopeptidase [Pseudomonadota bacterium]